MALDYFYGQVGELFSFYRIPKALFLESRFQNLSTDAKTLYGILLDRMSLSAKNGWLDEQGRVFIIFTIEDVKRALCCADNKATKLLRELEEFGLIERKRRGLGRPSLVYVKNFSAECTMKEKRDETIILRLSKTEKNRIYEKMLSMGIRSLSAYIRKMALDGYCLHLNLPQLRRMAYLLQMCSNNLNQYAKAANENGRVYAADMEDLRQRLDELIDIGKQILSKLAEL